MNSQRVIKLIFNKSLAEISALKVPEYETLIINSFDTEQNGKAVSYIVGTDDELIRFFMIVSKYFLNVDFEKKDITDTLMNGRINLCKFSECPDFYEAVETLVYSHMNVDDVLDKISFSGMGSLNEKELNILKII
jgi:hypothetical protein